MRRILIDFALSRQRQKRGGKNVSVTLDDALGGSSQPAVDLLALDDALEDLGKVDSRKSQVLELRFLGGLSAEETAEVLKIFPDTVIRDWKFARTWLTRDLSGEERRGT